MTVKSKHREPLRVWHREGLDYAIARTAEEAHAAWCEHVGEVVPANEYRPWQELGGADPLTIWCDSLTGHVAAIDDEGAEPVTRFAADWAARYEKPTFLASTEA